MRKLDAAEFRRMPWKNGGGITTQLAIWPPDAGMHDFHWRISSARVEQAGPFSRFDGVDRSLALLQGDMLVLRSQDGAACTLKTDSPPCSFTGEQPLTAELPAGPVIDFNVMTRRMHCRHRLEQMVFSGTRHIALDTGQALLYCAEGDVRAACERTGLQATLQHEEALLLDRASLIRVHAEQAAILYLASISFAGAGNDS